MNGIIEAPVVGIDRGASFTDFGVIHNGELKEAFSLKGRDWKSIIDTCKRMQSAHRADHMVFSGSPAGMPQGVQKQAMIINEIDAIGFGGAALADCRECLVVSMGTGSAIVHFANNTAKHVGGTGVGGGTITGLASLLCGVDDPAQIEALALKGDTSKINLNMAHLGYEMLSFLGADVTASNFAQVASKKTEDLAAGVTQLVAETVGIIASICARECNCCDHIVMVGKVAQNQLIRHILSLVGKLYQTTFIFPDNPGYATVYGAVLKYQHDLRLS